MAIVLAGLVTLVLQGNYSYFGYSNATIDWSEEWVTILSLGIFAGLIGGLYGRLMIMVVSPKGRIGGLRARHPYWFAAGCGVIVSTMAWVFGAEVLGAGYTETKMALQDEQALSPMYWLVKFTSTLVSFASGAPGGVFSPTLSIGAGFGHFYANLIDHEAAPLMLLAMVGVLSAVTHCPITAFVIVLEMVDNHELVMPLIFVSAVATQVSKRLLPSSIYQLLANHIKVSFAPVPETPAAATTPADATSTADGNKPAGTNQAAGS
jgi:H+/Cl- antiporter ClcA